jgi:hypothetical protein
MKLFSFLLLAVTSFAATTARPADSISIFPSGYQTNKYQYTYAQVLTAMPVYHNDETWTRFVVSPVGTYQTFKETLTFCQDVRQNLDFTNHDLTVFIYERAMHTRGCFDLLRIDVIQKARIAGKHNETH